MCGVCGCLVPATRRDGRDLTDAVSRMAAVLAHRGPDDRDTWVDAEAGVALGHRRLSVVDLSPLGRQPMASASGRYVVTLNGEIYNYRELRHTLAERHAFRGASDTEVFLAAVEEWGVADAVRRSSGMFAIALWDRKDRRLHLVRDRIGEKPLYYGWNEGAFLFGSELKAFLAHPRWRGEIDRSALSLFFRFNYIPAPTSIYVGIRKLMPGTIVTIDPSRGNEYPEPVPYWSYRDVAAAGVAAPFRDEAGAADELDQLLRNAVAKQMVADVPLGALLSGGVDSSTIVALMQAQSSRPVKTFTIGFHEAGFDEAREAAAVARHLGTDHTELYVTPRQAMDVIPSLPQMYDEPFADSSQIPTYLVSHMARQHVTVALSGDGGDELFGGYNRYVRAPHIWRRLSWLPLAVRGPAAVVANRVTANQWNRVAAILEPFLPQSATGSRLGEKARKAITVLGSANPAAVYRGLVSVWDDPADVVIDAQVPVTLIESPRSWPALKTFEDRMMYLDAMTYLPDDILTKVDRAAMACSLETRVPFLDSRVVEFAARLPLEMKIRGGKGKHILRRILYRHVPQQLIERPKMGFGVPVGRWLRGPLREWAEDLLDERCIRDGGFLDAPSIRRLWQSHLDSRSDAQDRLWGVLMFQAWLRAARSPALP